MSLNDLLGRDTPRKKKYYREGQEAAYDGATSCYLKALQLGNIGTKESKVLQLRKRNHQGDSFC